MKYEEVVKKIHSIPAGQFVNIETAKELKVRAGFRGNKVVKFSHKTVRAGVNYDKMKSTINGRATGVLPAQNAGLSYGEWIPGQENYFIEHKGQIYLRVASSPNKSINTYFINGKIATKDEAEKMCLASEFKSNGKVPSVMNIKIESIVNIGK